MKIKVAILDSDPMYLSRIAAAFGTKYPDKLEIYSFSSKEQALPALAEKKVDMLLSDESFGEVYTDISERVAFAFLVNSTQIERVNGKPAICKFQRAEDLYKQILGVFSEKASEIEERPNGMGATKTRLICFASPAGGVGTSSVAAACALHFAGQGKRTLYLNTEQFGNADTFFSAPGGACMSDVIYALKSGKANLAMKLESSVKQDPRGVFFYSAPRIALDMMEFQTEEILRLLNELMKSGAYADIILDMDFSADSGALQIYRKADSLIWVSDGSEVANEKLLSALQVLRVQEQGKEDQIVRKIQVIYNKFSNKTSQMLNSDAIRSLGGAPRFEHAKTEQILDMLQKKGFYDQIDADLRV